MTVHAFDREVDWLKRCIVGETGKPLPVLANVVEALRCDQAIRDCFAFDEMARMPILMHEIGQPFAPFEPRPVSDTDIVHLQNWLQRAGLKRVAKDTVR